VRPNGRGARPDRGGVRQMEFDDEGALQYGTDIPGYRDRAGGDR
jgi:hypothetical protein